MNEINSNLNWDDLKLFLAIARAGGLSGAIETTGKSAPTLGRRMHALEVITGHELFHRQARGYELTEQGATLLNKVTDLETQILPIDRTTENQNNIIIKVSAGSWVTRTLCLHTQAILKDNENIRLRFIAAENFLDISRRETIIGIRNQRPHQNGLAYRKLASVQFAGYATSKQVKPWVRVIAKTPSALWLAAQLHKTQPLEVTAPRNALDLATIGIARALLPTFIGDAEPNLIRVTAPIPELTHDQWLVTHQDERHRPEVRLTIDRIVALIKSL